MRPDRKESQEVRRKRVNHVGIHPVDFLLVPNILSMSRLIFAIPAVWLIFISQDKQTDLIAAVFLFFSFISDVLDGWWARTFRCVSDLGKILDPVIDKIVVISTSVALTFSGREPSLPIWVLLALVIRDVVILVLARRALQEDHHLFVSSWTGKAATFVMAATLMAFLLKDWAPPGVLEILPWVVLGLLGLSSIDYLEKYWGVRHKRYIKDENIKS